MLFCSDTITVGKDAAALPPACGDVSFTSGYKTVVEHLGDELAGAPPHTDSVTFVSLLLFISF